jgi:hypothetical protein
MSLVSQSFTVVEGNLGVANAQIPTAVGDQILTVTVALPSATTDHHQPLNLGASTAYVSLMYLKCTGVTIQVETNNITGSGGDTFTMRPGFPLLWADGMATTRPLTQALTGGLYLTNAQTTTGTFSALFVVDPTGP